jgi:signal transduction histidine kinase
MERLDSIARISVRDHGRGIDASFRPYIFDAFRQAEIGTTRKQVGLGLGLNIARHLVDLHGGVIRAESAGIGLRTTMTVELPLTA